MRNRLRAVRSAADAIVTELHKLIETLRADLRPRRWAITVNQSLGSLVWPAASTTLADLVYAAILCRDFFGSAGIAEAVA